MSALSQYDDAIKNAPARGQGLHQFAMKIARLGVMAELPAAQILADSKRLVGLKAGEMEQAISKAANTPLIPAEPKPEPSRFKPKIENALEKFIEGMPQDEMELIEASPIRLLEPPEKDAHTLIETLYKPDEYLFIGDVYDKTVKQAKDWLNGSLDYPHIIPNPMTGEFGTTGSGAESRRCEETVADLRYAVCEMDTVPLEKQVAFWLKCISKKLPVAAVIHSGGKSLHGWMKVSCGQDAAKWDKDVKGWLFGTFGDAYGFDKACATKARLSRLAGHYRKDKGRTQTLLYLNGDLK